MGTGISFVAQGRQDTDTEFRDWANKMHISILQTGWTDTSASAGNPTTGSNSPIPDSNFNNVTRPSANIAAGFIVYEMHDPLSGSFPVYAKIWFGTGAFVQRPAIWTQVGTSHDGSGSLTGSLPYSDQDALYINFNPTDNQGYQWYVGGATGSGAYLTLTGPVWSIDGQSSPGANFGFGVERTKSPAGADTLEGVLVGSINQGTAYNWWSLPRSGSLPAKDTEFPTIIGTRNPSSHRGRHIASPVYPIAGVSPNPGRNFLAVQQYSFAWFDILPVSIYPSITDHYLFAWNSFTSVANASTGYLLMRWT